MAGTLQLFWALLAHVALCSIARSARGDVRWVAAVFVGSDGTEKRCSAISSCRSAARTSRSAYFVVARRGKAPPLAPPQHGGARFSDARNRIRSARGDVRWVAAFFVGSAGTESVVPPSAPAYGSPLGA